MKEITTFSAYWYVKVEHKSVCSFFKMKARWKKDLHKPDKNNPNKKINSHWHFDY